MMCSMMRTSEKHMILQETLAEIQEAVLSRKMRKWSMSRQEVISSSNKLHLQSSQQDNLGRVQNLITVTHLHKDRAKKVKIMGERLERNIRGVKENLRMNKVSLIHGLLVHLIMRKKNAPIVPKTASHHCRYKYLECAKMDSLVAVVHTKNATAISTYTKQIQLGENRPRAQVIIMQRKGSMVCAWMASPASDAGNRVITVFNTSLKTRADKSKVQQADDCFQHKSQVKGGRKQDSQQNPPSFVMCQDKRRCTRCIQQGRCCYQQRYHSKCKSSIWMALTFV